MADVREQRQRERAHARAGRTSETDEPNESNGNEKTSDPRHAITAALTAAVAGALAGAAKAAIDKHGRGAAKSHDVAQDADEDDQDSDSTPRDDAESPEPAESAAFEDDEGDEQDHVATSEGDGEATDDGVETDDSDEPERNGAPSAQRGQQDGSEKTGASSSDVSTMIGRAKQHVEAVLDSEAETVSGIERSNGNWRVNVEVVQLRRIPESTDILASYAVVLDGAGDLISLQEVRRYRRSQAEDG